jgi:hypothetical protein
MGNLTGRHKGAVFIVSGTSPHYGYLPSKLVRNAIIVGVNNYPLQGACDYWITCDTHRIQERMPRVMTALGKGVETFMNADFPLPEGVPEPTYWFTRPDCPMKPGFQPAGDDYPIPLTWEGKLQHIWTSATAAANLAVILGAESIILRRVCLTGTTLSGGRQVPWANFVPDISKFFNRLPVPVYKLNPDSPLDIPLWR